MMDFMLKGEIDRRTALQWLAMLSMGGVVGGLNLRAWRWIQ